MDTAKLIEMDKLQRSDHDTLIRLEGKVDTLIINLATMQTGMDTRMRTVEAETRLNTQWIHDFNHTYKIIVAIAAGISSLVSFVVTFLAFKSEIFK